MAPPHQKDDQHEMMEISEKSLNGFWTKTSSSSADVLTTKPIEIDISKPVAVFKSCRAKKLAIYKDLFIVCLSFLLHFSSYNGTNMMQSSINGQQGIAAMTAASISGMVSTLLLSALVIDKLGIKWAMMVSLMTRAVFPMANLHSAWWTLYPGGAIAGLAVGPIWASSAMYVTWLGQKYARMTGEPAEAVIARFFGIFFMSQRMAHLLGNFLSSVLLRRSSSINATDVIATSSEQIINEVCGSRYCYENLNEIFKPASNFSGFGHEASTWMNNTSTSAVSFYRPSDHQLSLLFGTFAIMAVIAAPLIILVTAQDQDEPSKSGTITVTKKLLATLRHISHIKSILLLPYQFFLGVAYAFIITSFNVAFITCVLGVDRVGYVMVSAAAAGAISSIVCGWLVKLTGRRVIITLGCIGTALTYLAMLTWSPSVQLATFLYVLIAFWGGTNAIMVSQFTAFISTVYRNGKSESSAHSTFHLCQATGLTVWQSISVHLCIGLQIYVILALLALGLLGVLIVDVMVVREQKLLEEQATTKL